MLLLDAARGREDTHSMRIRVVLLAVVLLAACTPEQIAMVEHDYAARFTARAVVPSWSITANCTTARVVLSNWTDVLTSPSGYDYVSVGMGSMVDMVKVDPNGNADVTLIADQGVANTPAWGWSLIGTRPVGHGLADC